MQRMIPLGALVSVAVLTITAVPASGHSQPVPSVAPALAGTAPGLALFEGTTIDLAEGWGDAEACLVWRAAGAVECFTTAAAMTEREVELSQSLTVAAAAASCASPLRLYENSWYGGRQLSFWDYGYWQNLGDYGFNDRLSSYKIGSCYAHLAEHSWGNGWWYPGNTGPYHWEPGMSSGWNDRASSIYNE